MALLDGIMLARITSVVGCISTAVLLAFEPTLKCASAFIVALICYICAEVSDQTAKRKSNDEKAEALKQIERLKRQEGLNRDRDQREHADQKERTGRLRACESFLLVKERLVEATMNPQEIQRMYFTPGGALDQGQFRIECAKVMRDISNARSAKFLHAEETLCRMTPQGLGVGDSREILASAIRAVLSIVRAE